MTTPNDRTRDLLRDEWRISRMDATDAVTSTQARVVQEAWRQASPMWWEHRARQLEDARPRPGDYTGRATLADLVALGDRLTASAAACRNAGRVAAGFAELAVDDVAASNTRLASTLTVDQAERLLRAAIAGGDPAAIAAATAQVDALDPALAPPDVVPVPEPVPELIARHRRVIAAVDTHLTATQRPKPAEGAA